MKTSLRNITITLDENVARWAKIEAARRDTSVSRLLASILEGFASGHLRPLPVRVFAVSDAETAFRFMAQARHVGKLALRADVAAARSARLVDGTVLITGGLSGLGLEVARTLAKRGVSRLLLAGRRGAETPGAQQAVEQLKALGADATVAAVDVADRDALAALLGIRAAPRARRPR